MTKDELKALIRANVYENNNKEITGANLQEVLLAMVDNSGSGDSVVKMKFPEREPDESNEESDGWGWLHDYFWLFDNIEELSQAIDVPVSTLNAIFNSGAGPDLGLLRSEDEPYWIKMSYNGLGYDYDTGSSIATWVVDSMVDKGWISGYVVMIIADAAYYAIYIADYRYSYVIPENPE